MNDTRTMTTRKSFGLVAVLVCAFFSITATAAIELVPAPPKIGAKAYLLMDHHSGRMLAQHKIDKRIEPASMTKLMTTYVVLYEIKSGAIKLDDKVRISEKAWRMKGSRMFVNVNSRVPVKELMMGMIVQSGNDATVALAEHTAGSEDAFVTLMNKHAVNLGMDNTRFTNSTGWPHRQHYSTVRDLSILAQAIIRDFPKYYPWYSVKEYTYNKITQKNRNKLLWRDERVDGLKTGHTEAAGYCLITSAKQKNMRLISIVTGSTSENGRTRASQKLINYGFRFFETYRFHGASEPLTEIRIWKGVEDTLRLGLTQPLFITTPRGMREKVRTTIDVDENIMAPAIKGQKYGKVVIKLGDATIDSRPLVAMQGVAPGGLWTRMVDNIILLFH